MYSFKSYCFIICYPEPTERSTSSTSYCANIAVLDT